MAKTRSQEEDTKGKGAVSADSTEQRISKLETAVVDIQKTLDQRFAELRDLLGLRIDCDEEQLPVMDDETDLLEEETTPQSKVPIANSEIVKSIELGKVDLGLEKLEHVVMNETLEQEWDQMNVNGKLEVDGDDEKGQEVMSNTKICSAHHLFDKMLLRVQSRRGHIKCHKTWRFKFKQRVATRESKSGFEVNKTHNQSKEYPCLFLASNAATLGHMLFESFPFLNFAAEQPLLWIQNKAERILIVSKLERKKKKLSYKTWMFKYKVDEENKGTRQSRTGWVQEVSAVICFLRRRHFHLHLDCEEPELAGRKISETSDQCVRKRGLVSADHETEDNQLILRFLMWVIQNGLNQYMVLLLASVTHDAQFLVGVGMNKKQLRLSLRNNRVWDPGGSLVDAATPCLLSLHFTALHFIADILSFLKNLEVKVPLKEGDLLQENGHGLGWFMGLPKRRWAASQVIHEDRRIKEEQCSC